MKKENNLNVNFKKMFSNNTKLTQILDGMNDELLLVTKTLSRYEKTIIVMASFFWSGKLAQVKYRKLLLMQYMGRAEFNTA